MKKIIIFLFLFFLAITLVFSQEKPRIAVADFEVDKGLSVSSKTISESLTSEFTAMGKFTVLEREKLDTILKEAGLSASGLVDENTKVEAGKLKGVEIIVTGSLREESEKLVLNIRFIDTQTGAILLSAQFLGAKDKIKNILKQAAVKANEIYKLQGSVIEVESDNIYLDLGSESGVKNGKVFIIYKEGEELKDMQGKVISKKKEQVAEIQVTEVDKLTSLAKILSKKQSIERGNLAEEKTEEENKTSTTTKDVEVKTKEKNTENFKFEQEFIITPDMGEINKEKKIIIAKAQAATGKFKAIGRKKAETKATIKAFSILIKIVEKFLGEDIKKLSFAQKEKIKNALLKIYLPKKSKFKKVFYKKGEVAVVLILPFDKAKELKQMK